MKLRALGSYIAMLTSAALIAAGCSFGGGVDADSICNVRGDQIPIKGDERSFESVINTTLQAYEQQGQTPPEEGSREYEQLSRNAVDLLIREKLREQEAEDLDVEVTDEEIDERFEEIRTNFFDDDEDFEQQLTEQGLTEDSLRENIRSQIVREKIFEKVTEDVKVSEEDVREYFEENREQYDTAESRDVAHILVEDRAEAQRIYQQVQNGNEETFSNLAEENSQDPSSAQNGGRLTIERGQTVPEFDETAFSLDTGEVSQPVQTTYGWHVITARSDIKPQTAAEFENVQSNIEAQLVQEEKSDKMRTWEEDLIEDARDEVDCAEDYVWTETVDPDEQQTPPDNIGTDEGGEDEAGDEEAADEAADEEPAEDEAEPADTEEDGGDEGSDS